MRRTVPRLGMRVTGYVRFMVDWSLARTVAGLAGASEGSTDVGYDLVASADRLKPEVINYTGLHPAGTTPPAEVVDRKGWADANLTTSTTWPSPSPIACTNGSAPPARLPAR